jgi:uncharacterized protein (TIGR03086 family)
VVTGLVGHDGAMSVDLAPSARRMSDLIASIPDELLARPTPCPEYSLGDLLDHVSGFALAFTAAARKETIPGAPQRASGDASRLGDDWRSRIPRELGSLADAWRDPEAWTGMTKAGGFDLPGEVAGMVALDELVIHGWDVARASGQDFEVDPPSLAAVQGFVTQVAASEEAPDGEAIFGPPVEVPEDAPLLDRVLGLAGRDPAWTPG